MKRILAKYVLASIFMLGLYNLSAQNTPQIAMSIGEFVSGSPDSIYKATVDIAVGDSLSPYSVRVVVIDSSNTISDLQHTISSLSTSANSVAWKEGTVIHAVVPNVNPFIKRIYLIEFLNESEQVLLQIEKEF